MIEHGIFQNQILDKSTLNDLLHNSPNIQETFNDNNSYYIPGDFDKDGKVDDYASLTVEDGKYIVKYYDSPQQKCGLHQIEITNDGISCPLLLSYEGYPKSIYMDPKKTIVFDTLDQALNDISSGDKHFNHSEPKNLLESTMTNLLKSFFTK